MRDGNVSEDKYLAPKHPVVSLPMRDGNRAGIMLFYNRE